MIYGKTVLEIKYHDVFNNGITRIILEHLMEEDMNRIKRLNVLLAKYVTQNIETIQSYIAFLEHCEESDDFTIINKAKKAYKHLMKVIDTKYHKTILHTKKLF